MSDSTLKPTEDYKKLKHGRNLLKKKLTECNEEEIKLENKNLN